MWHADAHGRRRQSSMRHGQVASGVCDRLGRMRAGVDALGPRSCQAGRMDSTWARARQAGRGRARFGSGLF